MVLNIGRFYGIIKWSFLLQSLRQSFPRMILIFEYCIGLWVKYNFQKKKKVSRKKKKENNKNIVAVSCWWWEEQTVKVRGNCQRCELFNGSFVIYYLLIFCPKRAFWQCHATLLLLCAFPRSVPNGNSVLPTKKCVEFQAKWVKSCLFFA